MGGPFPLCAEVVQSWYQPPAEKGCPMSIHPHTSGQRIVSRDQPASQIQASTGEDLGFGRTQEHGRQMGLNSFGGKGIFAARVQESRPREISRPLLHHQRLGYFQRLSQFDNSLGIRFQRRGIQQKFLPQAVPLRRT